MELELREPVGNMVAVLPFSHFMNAAGFEDSMVGPFVTNEARLDVPDSFKLFYNRAAESDFRFIVDGECVGLEALDGKSGLDSLKLISFLAGKLMELYPDFQSQVSRNKTEPLVGNAINMLYTLHAMARMRPDAIWKLSF